MAIISITVPDAVLPRVRDAVCGQYGYRDTIPDPAVPGGTLPNPESKSQFLQRVTREWYKAITVAWEANKDSEAARKAAVAKAEADIILT